MPLSTPAIFLAAALLLSFLSSACGSGTSPGNNNSVPVLENERRAPIPTKEPDTYRGLLVITAGTTERRVFVARDGDRRRIDFDPLGESPLTLIVSGRHYLISSGDKVYAVRPTGLSPAPETAFIEDMVRRYLSSADRANIELLDETDASATYRVRPVIGDGSSESVIYVDKRAGFPVKQEFFSITNGERRLQYSIEFRDLRLDTEGVSFELPDGVREVPLDEFYRRIRS